MESKPHILIPTLIEQPTWGGDYIVEHKGLTDSEFVSKKIGQSFELFAGSLVSSKQSTAYKPSVALATAENPESPIMITNTENNPIPLRDILGEEIDLLIKFNQAKGNSYQVHVTEPTDNWLPKPESWLFLKPGAVTLGFKQNISVEDYKNACQEIADSANELALEVKNSTKKINEARKELAAIIKKLNPEQYVNRLTLGTNQAVDLSSGGIHHSWEEDPNQFPHGNIVYEVQKNVYDPDCTIRAFDKGKLKDDGSIRPVHIHDYFAALNTNLDHNSPANLIGSGTILAHTSTYTIREYFKTPHYHLQRLSLNQGISNKFTETTSKTFHHLFAQKGHFSVTWNQKEWIITQGFSLFIPINLGKYSLKPWKSRHSEIICVTR